MIDRTANGRRSESRRTDDPGHSERNRLPAFALLVLGALTFLAAAPRTGPRSVEDITRALAAGPHAGECSTCHTSHAGDQPTPYPHGLIGPNDNSLCQSCHAEPWAGGSYAGPSAYQGSAHGGGPFTIWPGPEPPARADADAPGKCLNCHDPHGWQDAAGEIPHLLLAREENLCVTCHDGSPAAANVRVDLQKPFRHPAIDYDGRHTGPTESLPQDFANTPAPRRHAECGDCHNAHLGRVEGALTSAGEMPRSLLGVSRVRVVNGPAGVAPGYFFTAGSDTLSAPVAEYQLCFKCHSSWTTQPAGQRDLARALNPNNASYHPVEAAGKNPGIQSAAFTGGVHAGSVLRCSDCHGSDAGAAQGPHGSIYRYILKRPYTASSGNRVMTSDELCFSCHSYEVYANPSAPDLLRAASRFNAPAAAGGGHAEHVGGQMIPCYACHETHGAVQQPHLMVTGRTPGNLSYTQTAAGGTCMPTCHASRTYTVNYGR